MMVRNAWLIRLPATVAIVWIALATMIPWAMTQYAPYLVRPGIRCVAVGQTIFVNGVAVCQSLAELYHRDFTGLFVESMFRSLALLGGAAVLALTLGTLLGISAALLRRRALVSAGIVSVTTVLTAVPAFFIAYFLQIAVILVGATAEGSKLLPVFGFGYDEHLVLPLLSIAAPAVAFTAQLTATRVVDILDADFITAAHAKGLPTSTIIFVHVLPHVRPTILEALGSGLRVSVASLPIIEYLFLWRGIGQLSLEAVGVHDAPGLVFCGIVLATIFICLSVLSDTARPATHRVAQHA